MHQAHPSHESRTSCHEPTLEPRSNCRPLFQPTGLVLWSGDGQVRIGDGEEIVLLNGVSRAAMRWLHSLDGSRTWSTIVAEGPDADALRLFRAAWQRGCIDDASIRPGPWWRSVGMARDGEAQRRALLHQLGSAVSAHALLEQRQESRIVVVGNGTLAHQAIAIARRSQLRVGWLQQADGPLPADTACCVIADGGHPEVAGRIDQSACQVPHLVLRAFGLRAVVGPVVIPGQTSCLACAHLHHVDAQAGWAQVAVQLTALTQRGDPICLDPVVARLAAGHAILLARRVIDAPGHAASQLGNRAFLWSAGNCAPRELARPAHPLCGCSWGNLSE